MEMAWLIKSAYPSLRFGYIPPDTEGTQTRIELSLAPSHPIPIESETITLPLVKSLGGDYIDVRVL